MDPIKEAFSKAKQDIFNLQSEIYALKQEIQEINQTLNKILNQQTNSQTIQPTNQHINQSELLQNPTLQHIPTHKTPLYALKSHYTDISTGNEGVPTNKPTNH